MQLGIAGVVVAALVVIFGFATAIASASAPRMRPMGMNSQQFVLITLVAIASFAGLVTAAVALRKRADLHKRLMTLGTIALTSAPIARLPFVRPVGPPAFFGLTDLFIVAMLVYDLATRRKVHPATIWGGLVIVASQPLRLMISGTPAWLAFAGWLTNW